MGRFAARSDATARDRQSQWGIFWNDCALRAESHNAMVQVWCGNFDEGWETASEVHCYQPIHHARRVIRILPPCGLECRVKWECRSAGVVLDHGISDSGEGLWTSLRIWHSG